MAETLAGRLLVAAPALLDPNFARSVVLVCRQDERGALGVVLNRPLEDELAEYLPEWTHLAPPPARVFGGGPVQPEAALALGRLGGDPPEAGWTAVTPRIGLLDLRLDPADLWGSLDALRVFGGYAGWGAGQLEGELAEGAWIVADAAPDDPFSEDPEGLWERVLGRRPGGLAPFAAPGDPSRN